MDKEHLLHLLIIDDSRNDAEQITSLLRNAGYAIRPSEAEDEQGLRELVREQVLDLILCSTGPAEPSLQQVQQTVADSGQDIPLLALTATPDIDLQIRAMTGGALDLVCKEAPEHLLLTVRRELNNLDARRRMRGCQQFMRESEKRCHALLDSSRDAITYVHEGMHIYANPAYLEMFGFSEPEDIEGMPIMDMIASQDHGKLKEFLRRRNKGDEGAGELEVVGTRSDNSTFTAAMDFSPASIEGEPCTQIVIRDRSIDKELENKLQYLSKQDLLTGLYNRQYFLEELEQSIADVVSGADHSAVLYIELDNFKGLKENIGIAGSDLVLSDIANLVQDTIGAADVAARFGDCTLTVLTRNRDAEAARELAEQIRKTVESHISDVGETSVTVSCSIGINPVDDTAEHAQEFVLRADLACEIARNKGGNQCRLHNPVADEQAGVQRDQECIDLIRDALDHDRFILVYQPIASLHGESGERYEVLLRMKDQDGQEVMPGQFIPVAEQHKLINAVDRWVISNAIRVLTERRRGGNDTTFFLKISGMSLADETLLPWISQQLKKVRLHGDSVVFELSESAAVANLKHARLFVNGIRELRCKFSLEHFGNGMNSFQLLKHLPADYLKIDGSFMHNLADNQEHQAMVKSIAEMAHSTGRTTIAEFVEDASSLAVLWQCGVNYIQGHFLRAPDKVMDFDFQGEEA